MQKSRGFTLIEIVITVAVIALISAVVIPALSSLGVADVRRASGQLSGLIRSTYDDAVLQAETHRLVITIGAHEVTVEKASVPSSGPNLLAFAGMMMGGGAPAGDADGDSEDAPDEIPPPPELAALFGVKPSDEEEAEGVHDNGASVGLTPFKATGAVLNFGEEVRILDVWPAGEQKPLTEGKVYLNFFPGGYCEEMLIHLAPKEGSEPVFTVRVAPLTGSTDITAGYVEAKP